MLQETIALVATLLVVVSYIPQLWKSYRTKSAEDLSLGFLLIITAGVFMWCLYGFIVEDYIFLAANIIILANGLLLLGMKIRYG